MRLLPLFAVLALSACGGSSGGTCNSCENWSLDTEACAAEAERLGCETYEVVEVTDDSCGVGQPPTTHLVCEYDDCPGEDGLDFDCDAFSAPPL